MRIDRILIPVDFSPASRLALRYAVAFARRLGASLVVTHVVESGSALDRILGPLSWMARKEQQEEALRLLPALFSEQLRTELRPRFLVEAGPVADRLVTASRREKADLVIMGTHGRSLFHRALMGSVTQDVLTATEIPVLTVSHSGRPLPIGRILLATKLSAGSSDVAQFAEAFAMRANARLIAFHAVDVGVEDGAEESTYLEHDRVTEAQSTLDQWFADAPAPTLVEARLAEVSVPAAILKSADEHDADLIVVGKRKEKGGARSALGSIGDRLIREAAVPVLSVPIRSISRIRQAA